MKLQQQKDQGKSFFITLPKQLMEAMKWKKGDEIITELYKGHIILKKK